MSNLQIAETIIQQMSGTRRLKLMVGAHSFLGDKTGVQFSFKGCRKANTCRVLYNKNNDLYTFELWKHTKRVLNKVYELEGVYCDMLQSLFEEETGLYLSL